MSALTKRVAALEAELGEDWRKYHVAAQLRRFATGVLASVLWSMHSGLSDWTDLVPVVSTAMWVTAAQMWPKVPWWLVHQSGSAGTSGGAAASGTG